MKKLLLLTALLSLAGIHAEAINIPENCTAFLTRKSMFFSDRVEVIGINCSQEIQLEEKNNRTVLTVKIPGDQFKTGNPKRNSVVGQVLGDKLIFTAELSLSQIQNLSTMQKLQGMLKIKEKISPVSFKISSEGRFLIGIYTSSLTDLSITPPVAGPWDLIAKTHDTVTLGFKVDRAYFKKGELK